MIARLLAVLALLLAAPLAAHQQKIAISILSHNDRTGMLEVVHQVPLHDAEHALRALGIRQADIINSIESRRAFARYVADRFELAADGKPVELALLGSEIEAGGLYVYQEAPSPGRGSELEVRSMILVDIWARQENRVNFGDGTNVETLIFRAGDPPRRGLLP
ncbi:MAG: DUF6702 family protein [Erythrobacter sp.]|jgi:hypothetical protein|nr:DUF6702 family protein [Erythrobacter sp.]